ncbi:MAG TPA: glycine cleavage T C-terminal barrel domain-containing protein [Sphingomonas sp.]|nr:glycine cleavage T C-terminal barrel domain-containing protein [Sphingomonas sp.]
MSDETDLESTEPQTLPLDAWHRARGGRMVPFAGYWMPVQYEGIMAEHLWVRGEAGLFDVSHMGQLHLSGDGLDEALEALIPADVKGLKSNAQKYSLLLADNGGILDDLMLTRWDDGSIYMVVNGAVKYDDIGHLRDHLPDEITLNHMDEQALLALQGPKAAEVLARLVPGVAELTFMKGGRFDWNPNSPSPSGEGKGVGDVSPSATPAALPHPNPSPEGEGLAVSLWISRSGYTGEDGFEISLPAAHAEALADALCGQPEVKPIGLGARDSLRLEADLPLYGHDLDPDTTPIMAALGFAVASKRRREEANFPGAERILMEREQGAIVRRVGLVVDGRQPVREGAAVLDAEGSEVGKVTSGGFAPSLEVPIAMAYVPIAMSEPGTRLQLTQRGKVHEATVAPMPFVPHRYVRAGGK